MFDIVYRARVFVWLLCATMVAVAGFGLTKLDVSTDNRIFYGPENPYYQDFLSFEDAFIANDNLLFVIVGPDPITAPSYARAIRWLADEASGLSHVIRVDSLANYPHPFAEGDTLVVQPILDWGCPSSAACKPRFAEVLSQSHLLNRLVSEDLRSTGVIATISLERGAVGKIEALHASAKELAERFKGEFPGYEIVFTGGVPMMAAFAEATATDLSVLLPSSFVAIALLLTLVLGSIRLAGSILILGLLSIVATFGVAGWTGHTVNNATSIVPLIVFTLVVTSSMHIVVHFARNIGAQSAEHASLSQARASLSSSLVPVVISAATSAVSLLSLWLVDSPPIRELGVLSALGVLVGCGFSILVLPIMLVSVKSVASTQFTRLIQSWINRQARRLELRKDSFFIAAALFILASSGVFFLSIDDDFVRFFDESVEFRINTDRATELLAGPNHIEVVVTAEKGSVFEPAFIQYLSQLADHLRANPLVANAHSFSDVMETIAEAFSGTSINDIEAAAELSQLFLVYELSLQLGQTNTDLISSDQKSARISVLLTETTSGQIQDLERSIYQYHDQETTGAYSLIVTGENIPVAHLSKMNIRSMIGGIFASLAFTALVVTAAFRSIRLGIIALAATAIPVLAGFGAWGWISSTIGLAATGVIALTVGVVVDDATHYIYRALDGRNRLGLDAWPAAAYATHRAGTAIVSTSVVMGVGLSILLLSDFQVNSSFGAVACLIIGTALAFNLYIIPRLTVWAVGSRNTMESAT